MAWQNPFTSWTKQSKLTKEAMNRIEGNLQNLSEKDVTLRSTLAAAITSMGQPISPDSSYEELATRIKDISKDATAQPEHVLAGQTFFSGGRKQTGIWPGPMFGTGELGHYSSKMGTPIPCNLGELVVLDCQSFTLNAGTGIWTENPVRALVIRSWGNIVINGSVMLDNRGGFGDRYLTIGGVEYDLLGGLGGNGGQGGRAWTSNPPKQASYGGEEDTGLRLAGGMLGGGGGGGGPCGGNGGQKNAHYMLKAGGGQGGYRDHVEAYGYFFGGRGVNGSGGGGGAYVDEAGGLGAIYAGSGGDITPYSVQGVAILGGGATGGGGGITAIRLDGTAYGGTGSQGNLGGGVLIVIAAGDVIINGKIFARGGDGGRGGNAYGGYGAWWMAGAGGGGGGSGGGRVIILHKGNYVNNGIVDLSGGQGGLPGDPWWDPSLNNDIDRHLAIAWEGYPGLPGSMQVVKL